MKKKRVLLKDIAAEANCSLAAVSRALSRDIQQQRLVARDTFDTIMQAAERLEYSPQQKPQRSLGTVGVFVPMGHSSLTLELLNGITQAANEVHTPLHCYNYQDGSGFTDFVNHHLSRHRTTGVLSYYPWDDTSLKAFLVMHKKLTEQNIPLVIIHNDAPENFHEISVKFDNYYGGKLAGRHLLDHKCREYFILGNIKNLNSSMHYSFQRLQGCYNELTADPRNVCHMLTNNMGYSVDNKHGLIELLYKMVNWRQDGPVGIFCDNDRLATYLMTFLLSKQISIGTQAKIVGYNGESFTASMYPALTTVKQDFYKLGFTAMHKLFNIMRGKNESSLLIKPELIVRSST